MNISDSIYKLRRIALAFAIIFSGLFVSVRGQNGSQALNELGELQFGPQYDAPRNTVTTGFFVAPKTGSLTILFRNGYASCLFTDPEFKSLFQGKFNNHFDSSPSYSYDVTEGTTYYLKISRSQYDSEISFFLLMEGISEIPFEATQVSPQAGEETVYNLTRYPEMFVRYSQNISGAQAMLTYRSNGGEDLTVDLSNRLRTQLDYLYIPMAAVLQELLENEGEDGISPDAPISIRVKAESPSGQLAAGADSEGWLEYHYLCGRIPVTVVSTNWPAEFLSYWPEGSEDGIASVTYSEPLRTEPAPTFTLHMGNNEGQLGKDYYQYSFPASVEGNTVYIDLTGVRRSYKDLFSNPSAQYDIMSVEVSNIYSENDVAVVSNYSGSVGKYIANLPFKNLQKASVLSDYLPPIGSNLIQADKIEVWISGLNSISFNGFTVETVVGSQTLFTHISEEEITRSDESPDGNEAVFTFAIPSMAATAQAVFVYPSDLVAYDGYDHLSELTATYNTFTAIISNPSNGADVADLTETNVEAVFNYMDEYPEMYVTFQIIEEEDGENLTVFDRGVMTRGNGMYSITIDRKLKLYTGHTYKAVFTAWENQNAYDFDENPLGSCTLLWYGQTPEYIYSDVVLENLMPELTTALEATNGSFTLSFDNLVRIDLGSSYYVPFMSVTENFVDVTPDRETSSINPRDGQTYSTAWTVDVKKSFITSDYPELKLYIVVVDPDGQRVKGNSGTGEDTAFEFTYYNSQDSAVEVFKPEEKDSYDIYTLTGIRLMKDAPAESIKTLSPGIYIINGKKVKI